MRYLILLLRHKYHLWKHRKSKCVKDLEYDNCDLYGCMSCDGGLCKGERFDFKIN